jgi:hypothetical protein
MFMYDMWATECSHRGPDAALTDPPKKKQEMNARRDSLSAFVPYFCVHIHFI